MTQCISWSIRCFLLCAVSFAVALTSTQDAAAKGEITAKQLMSAPADGYQLARERKYTAAKEWAINRLKQQPSDADALFLKASMENYLRQSQDVLDTTSKLLALKYNLGAVHKIRSDAYAYINDTKKSLDEVNQAVKIMPQECAPLQLRWKLYALVGRTADADRDHRIRAVLSQLYFSWDNTLDEAFKNDSSSQQTKKLDFQEEFAAGQQAFARLAYQQAADSFTRVLSMKPETLDAYLYRAQALASLNKWSQALGDLSHLISQGEDKTIVVRAAPDNAQKIPFKKWVTVELPMAEAYKRRAKCYSALQKHSQALSDLNIALKHQPDDKWLYENRGTVYSDLKKYKQAFDDFTRAEHLDPTNVTCAPKIVKSCIGSGDYKTAVIRISWLLKNKPTDETLLLDRADALSHLGFHKEASEDLTFILSMKQTSPTITLRRAREYEALREWQRALADYTFLASLSGSKSENSFKSDGLEGKARVSRLMMGADVAPSKTSPIAKQLMNMPLDGFQLARTRQFVEARNWAIKQLKTNPNDGDVLHLKAWMEILLSKPHEAVETTTALLALKSHVGYAHKMRSEAYFMLEDGRRALVEINEAIKLMPHEDACFQFRSRVYAGLGRVAEADRDHKIRTILSQLYCAWDKVVEENMEYKRPSPLRKNSVQQEFASGQKAFAGLAFHAAADYFTRVIELRPDLLDAYLYRAQSLEAIDQWNTALVDLNHLVAQGANTMIPIRVAPDDARKVPFEKWPKVEVHMAEAYKRRARCYASMQKHNLAIQDLNIAVKQQPEDRWTFESRGNAFSGAKQYKNAINDYIQAERLEPTYTNTTAKIIECCINAGDYKTAIIRISWHLKNTPVDDVMLLERARAFSHLGFHGEAIDDLTFVMSVTPDYKKAYLMRAKEYETLGIFDKALKDYSKAASLDPSNQDAIAGKNRIMQKLNLNRSPKS